MALMNDLNMNNAGELNDSFAPFPPGEYVLIMEESERKPTKASDGEYLNCVFSVADGEYKDRKLFHMFNLWNKNQQAVEIAKAQWRALCEATVGQPSAPNQDSASLHYKTFIGTVSVKAAEGNFPAKNEIVFRKGKIRSMQGGYVQPTAQPASNGVAPAVAPSQAPAVSPPVAAATGSRPAWAR